MSAKISLSSERPEVSQFNPLRILMGFARGIGDGQMYFYVQDVMVHPSLQGQGPGRILLNRIEQWLAAQVQPGATVALMAAKGKEAFYQQYGYLVRDGATLGADMSKFITR